MTYLERYLAGQHEQVWSDLAALGDGVRAPDTLTQARAVAVETMRRVRRNIELLIPRLERAGYQFGYGWADDPEAAARGMADRLGQPGPDLHERITAAERQGLILPLSLRAFYEVVGEVNFVGGYIPADELAAAAEIGESADKWLDATEAPIECQPLYVEGFDSATADRGEGAIERVVIAIEATELYGMSGSPPFWVVLPAGGADAPLDNEGQDIMGFVDYLRLCLRNGGFLNDRLPGLPDTVVSGLQPL